MNTQNKINSQLIKTAQIALFLVERVKGIEPSSSGWKPDIIAAILHPLSVVGVPGFEPGLNPPKGLVLPLHHTPYKHFRLKILTVCFRLVNEYGKIKNLMNLIKRIFSELNIVEQCKKYNLSLWQCPQFLFLVMGAIIVISSLFTYAFGTRYIEDPLIVAFIIQLLALILFVIAVIITRSFERLAEANRLKSEFVSIVSHQLRSPLSNLKWTIELLMSGKLGKIEEKQVEYFKIIKENSNRMHELVADLLTVSRIETAKLPFKKQLFSMEELVKKIINEYKPLANAYNVEVIFKNQKQLPNVFSDPSRIELVVENLLDNAIRYVTDKGKVEIELSKKNNHVRFSIKDNGVGIPQQDKKYIFQKFFRSENVLKKQTKGSGLGLYISKAIVERAKGKIGFDSEERKGSTFWFMVPIK